MPKITILKSLGNSDKSQKGQGCKKIGTAVPEVLRKVFFQQEGLREYDRFGSFEPNSKPRGVK